MLNGLVFAILLFISFKMKINGTGPLLFLAAPLATRYARHRRNQPLSNLGVFDRNFSIHFQNYVFNILFFSIAVDENRSQRIEEEDYYNRTKGHSTESTC